MNFIIASGSVGEVARYGTGEFSFQVRRNNRSSKSVTNVASDDPYELTFETTKNIGIPRSTYLIVKILEYFFVLKAIVFQIIVTISLGIAYCIENMVGQVGRNRV